MLYIFTIIINFALILVFFRFLIQLVEVNHSNPVVIALYKSTLVIDILSKSIPSIAKGRVNTACLVILVILYLVKLSGLSELYHQPIYDPIYLVKLSFVTMTQDVITFCLYLILGSIIGNLIMILAQRSLPFFEILQELAEPLLDPCRKVLPNMGMIDLSAILAIFLLSLSEKMMNIVAQVLLAGF